MKIFFSSLLLILTYSLTAYGQENIPKLIMHSTDVLRGSFVHDRQMKGFERPLRSQGTFVISTQNGLLWRVTSPFPVSTVITSTGLVQKSGDIQTLNLSSEKAAFMAEIYDMIKGILTHNWDILQEHFYIHKDIKNSPWTLRLIPRTPEASPLSFKEIKVKGTRFAEEVIIIRDNDERDVLTFKAINVTRSPLTAEELKDFSVEVQ